MQALPLILLIAGITFACRALPLLLLPNRPFGRSMSMYLRYLPLGVLAALAAVAAWPQGHGVDLPFVAGVGVAALLAVRTGNLLTTLLGAMAIAAALRAV